jgi:uncharacterized membrane protein
MNNKTLLTTLLIFSLAVNLVFIGVVVGRHLFGKPDGRAHFEWMMQEVSPETRDKLRSSMREHMQKSRPARKALRLAQQQLHSAIIAGNYVQEDVVAGLAEVRRASVALQESMHKQMVSNLEHLEPEERGHVLRSMMRRGRGGSPAEFLKTPEGPPEGSTED